MKKILIALAAVTIVGAGGYWFLSETQDPETETPITQEREEEQEAETEAAVESTYAGKLKEFMKLGDSLKCTFSLSEEGSGTTWIKGEETYTEAVFQANSFNTLTKDECVWTWSDENNQGIKICYDNSEEVFSEEERDSPEGVGEFNPMDAEIPEDFEFDCEEATIPDSRFEPPADVNFISMDDLMNPENMQNLQENPEDMLP